MAIIQDVISSAQGNWHNTLIGYGLEVPRSGKHGPCPICGGNDRFHFDDKAGKGTWHCRGCEPHAGDGLSLVAKSISNGAMPDGIMLKAAKAIAPILGIEDNGITDKAAIEANRRRAAENMAKEKKKAAEQEEAGAKLAVDIYKSCSPATSKNAYLSRKHIQAHGVKALNADYQNGQTTIPAGSLVIPATKFIDGKAKIRSLEFIGDTVKQGLKNAKRSGCFYPLDGSSTLLGARRIFVCEGFATAATIREVTGQPTVCCFSRSHIIKVCKSLGDEYPDAEVIVCADRDESGDGEKTASETGLRYFLVPEHDGSDWNDYALAGFDVMMALAECDISSKVEPEPEPEIEYIIPAEPEPVDDLPVQKKAEDFDLPFRILGHYKGNRYYLPNSTQQVVELSPAQHTKNNMLALAPMHTWEAVFGDITTKEGLDMSVNALFELSARAGLFNGDRLRGRGAWLDDGRSIVHMGQEVFIDGKARKPEHVESKYIYQQDIDLGVQLTKPAVNSEANQLIKLCKRLSWENDLSATLLAGWCVIAPLTGILSWRPHIWVTGPSGAGKSTVLRSIISVMLGDIALNVEGKTTEAGIRQQLGIDARPVLFDEAEAEDKQSIERLKGILDFARVCSSGGTVVKGSASGQSMSFTARTAFCFSSINTSVKHFADESRISQLVLKKDFSKTNEYFEELELDILNTINEDYSNAMFTRSVQHMSTLQQNCGIFVEAANIHFKSRRIADQVGVLLAGAYLCYSTKKIDREKALEWIRTHDWQDHTTVNSKTDKERLMSKILTHRLRVPTDSHSLDITLGEAISAVHNLKSDFNKYSHHCEAELKRHGIRIEGDRIVIANNGDPMTAILKDTPWESSWGRTLSEISGSEKVANSYYTAGIKCRGVSIPISTALES